MKSAASRKQSARDCARWSGWMNSRLEGPIARHELPPIKPETFADDLRSGLVLWRLLETCTAGVE